MFVMTRGLCHVERPDPSDKELTVKIPTSSVSITANCGYLWAIIFKVMVTIHLVIEFVISGLYKLIWFEHILLHDRLI